MVTAVPVLNDNDDDDAIDRRRIIHIVAIDSSILATPNEPELALLPADPVVDVAAAESRYVTMTKTFRGIPNKDAIRDL